MGIIFKPQSPMWAGLSLFLSFLLFLSLDIVPPLGLFISGFAITPLTLVLLERGKHPFVFGNGVFIAVLLLFGWGLGSVGFYLLGFVLPAIFLAEGLQRGKGVNRTLFASTLIPLAVGGALMIVLSLGNEENLMEKGQEQIEASLTELIDFYQASGMDPKMVEEFRQMKDVQAKILFSLVPSFLFVGFLGVILSNFLLIRFWYRKKGESPISFSPLSHWHLPDPLIWGFIGAVFLLLFPYPPGRVVGGNLLLILLVLYLIQGAALMVHLFQQKKVSYWVWILSFVLFIFWPTLLFVIFLGIADIWFDFRKIRESPA